MNRREFLAQAGLAAGVVAGQIAGGCGEEPATSGAKRGSGDGQSVAIVVDPNDSVVGSQPSRWAIAQLSDALTSRGISVHTADRIENVPASTVCVVVASQASAKLDGLPKSAESLAIKSTTISGRRVLLAYGADSRGIVYALTELADSVALDVLPLRPLTTDQDLTEAPANRVRGIGRLFCSDVEDKPWYNDRGFWDRYLTMLASNRFNRFHLALGLGYDVARGVTDSYFYFPYPFFLAVPGYEVRATNLPDAERDNNLTMLRYISDECAGRGIDFQLGLWGHQYVFADSPNVNHRIDGLTAETHAKYCRDGLTLLLKGCPNISGVTFRVHGESGVAEGSYDFWKTVFDGIVRSSRKLAIEMHAKGTDQQIIDIALATGMPVSLAPKYWSEHMGLPYAQTAIRSLEQPRADRKDQGFFAKSSGSRSFLRYGYGDLLAEDRKFDVVHRMWPGTQRMLLWGDPVFAAGFGRTSSFCGSAGIELFEPLTFKGRMGAGLPGGRQGYADESLKTAYDWEKYRYWYTLWGRNLFNPQTQPVVWQRRLQSEHGAAADPLMSALAEASRILPTLTTAHSQSASYSAWWVELSYNMPIIDPNRRHPFSDTPSPKRFVNVSPLDPQLFCGINEFVDQLLKGESDGRYTPAEVADRLQQLSAMAVHYLNDALSQVRKRTPAFRRTALDISIQAAMGMFFAEKLRAGMLWALHERTGDAAAATEALSRYRAARKAWAGAAEQARGAYASDITYGPSYFQRGHWLDRLTAIDQDIVDMEKHAANAPAGADKSTAQMAAILSPIGRLMAGSGRTSKPMSISFRHTPVESFKRGTDVAVEVQSAASVILHYRRVNQAEAWQRAELHRDGAAYAATIPAQYTDSPFPLQYYFELRDPVGVTLFPGFDSDWSNQPYFVVRQEARSV